MAYSKLILDMVVSDTSLNGISVKQTVLLNLVDTRIDGRMVAVRHIMRQKLRRSGLLHSTDSSQSPTLFRYRRQCIHAQLAKLHYRWSARALLMSQPVTSAAAC